MKSRCSNSRNAAAPYYIERGISVCAEWLASFEAFAEWAESSGYQDGLEIDRKRNHLGYCPDNCRWADRRQQMANTRKMTRKNITSQFKGVGKTQTPGRWRALGSKDGRPIHLGCFNTQEEAAKAYDQWAIETYGEFASTNFPATHGGVPF
jgi:hypothetical protein